MSNTEQQRDSGAGPARSNGTDGATAVHWRRYGHNRLYVTDADGTKIGWRDLLTGEDHVHAGDRLQAYQEALARWAPTPSPTGDAGPHASDGPDSRAPSDDRVDRPHGIATAQDGAVATTSDDGPVAEDLSVRVPGALARRQAVASKQAAPVRTFVARVLGVHTDERAWRIGAAGEEKVGAQLVKLARQDLRWRFIHSVPVGTNGSDIDHVVVGPGGVFTLNSKHHPHGKLWVGGNTVLVNGTYHPYIRNSRHEATRAARLLSAACGFPVHVTGIVVPVGADDVVIKAQPHDVRVVNRMRLVVWLRTLPPVLDEGRIEAVYRAASLSTTWRR